MRKFALSLLSLSLVVAACSDGGSDGAASAASASVAVATTATVTPLDPGVSVKQGAGEFVAITEPTDVQPGDLVRTDGTGFAEVNYPDGSVTRLDVNTEFAVVSITDNAGVATTRANLNSGRVWSRVNDLGTEGEFSVDTAVGVATVRGTAFMVDCRTAVTDCDFTVLEGRVEVTPPAQPMVGIDGPYTVHVDETTTSTPAPVPFDEAFSDPWITENARRDAEAGYESADEMYAKYGALVGSFAGQYDGTSRIVAAEWCLAPANCATAAGAYSFTYAFSVECPEVFHCTRYVDMAYGVFGAPTLARAEMRFEGTQYVWSLVVPDLTCGADSVQIDWALRPLGAVRVDGRWVIDEVAITSVAQAPAGPGCAVSQSNDGDCANRDDHNNDDNDNNGHCSRRDHDDHD